MPTGAPRNNPQDPWRTSREEGPPDLAHLFKKLFGKFQNPSSSTHEPVGELSLITGRFIGFAILGVLALWLLCGIFVVSPAEQAVILRFGKYEHTVGPGPHWIPALFERHYTVNIQRVDSFPYEADMLTQDGNIVSVKIQVQYRIADLKNFLFSVVAPINTLQQAASSSLRQVVGQMNLDPILTNGREELAQRVQTLLQQTLSDYHSGIEVREVTLQSSRPPEAVTAAFDDVIKATEDEKRYINQAEAYAKKRVLTAQGEAARISQEADAYRYSVVAQATGETARYLALLKPYQQAPLVTRERLYLDTLTDVLKNTKNILVDGGGNNVIYLPLNQLMQADAIKNTKVEIAPTVAPASVSENLATTSDPRPSYPIEDGDAR
ncbi:MAG: FtsH protease activity modulator HflK [Proteobacteria bacterium]|nr:FtsH protease activity modulator HflK [Pseudomonadota bacterium]